MAYAFNNDKSKGIIKTKTAEKTGVLGEHTTTVTFTKEQLGVQSLRNVTILQIKQKTVTYDNGWTVGGRYVFGTQIYPNCYIDYDDEIIVEGYNPDGRLRKLIFEITYLISDVEHAE